MAITGAVLAVLVAFAQTGVAVGSTADMPADSAQVLPAAPSGFAVPADGRLRADGFVATVEGVATGTATAGLRAVTGQRLWAWGVSVAAGPPALGGNPVTVAMTVTAATVTVPVSLPSPAASSGTLWFVASLPAAAPDVSITLAADESSAVFSLSKMARADPQPTASYRDQTSWQTTVTDNQTVTLPVSYADANGSPYPADPEPISYTGATLAYWAPDTPGHTATAVERAWLVVHLSTTQNDDDHAVYANDVTLPASALNLTVPGQPAITVTDFPGPPISPTSSASIYPDIFGADTYAFDVPADLTTATLTVTPGAFAADSSSTLGTATVTGTATFNLALPPPTPTTPPTGASTQPGQLSSALIPPVQRVGSGGATAARSGGHGSSSLDPLLVVIGLAVVALAAGAVIARRRLKPTPTVAASVTMPVFETSGPGAAWPSAAAAWPPTAATPPAPPGPVDAPPPSAPAGQAETTSPPPSHQPATPPDWATGSGPATLVLPDPAPPVLGDPSLRALGSIRLAGWGDLPARGSLNDLAVFLAAHSAGPLLSDTIRARLAGDGGSELSEKTLHTYIYRLRRQLGDARLESTRDGYQLHGVAYDLAVFATLCAQATDQTDLDAIVSYSSALALVTGTPYDTAIDYPWLRDEGLVATAEDTIADAGRRLDERATPLGCHERVLWGYHQALLASPIDQTLAARALTAASRQKIPGGLDREWQTTLARLAARKVEPAADLAAHYQQLTTAQRPPS